MAKDVEMADAAAPAPAAADDQDKAPPPFDVAQGVAKNVGFVRKAVEGAQPRLLARALRNTTPIRRKCKRTTTGPPWALNMISTRSQSDVERASMGLPLTSR